MLGLVHCMPISIECRFACVPRGGLRHPLAAAATSRLGLGELLLNALGTCLLASSLLLLLLLRLLLLLLLLRLLLRLLLLRWRPTCSMPWGQALGRSLEE